MEVETLKKQALEDIANASSLKQLDEIFRRFLGRQGELTGILRSLSSLPKEARIKQGKEANALRDLLNAEIEKRAQILKDREYQEVEEKEWIDISAPGTKISRKSSHPLTLVQRQMLEIFQAMGFGVAEGPEIEEERYNFDALNIPASHPSRDMWDTFWLKPKNAGKLLRTHTSPVQIRYMEKHNPPFRIVAPGKVFRYEATDARHGFELYQLEGLMVGDNISAANFKGMIETFYERFFSKSVNVRLRPSYFPFVEPGFEVDMTCVICSGKGTLKTGEKCSTCGAAGWIEMMGAGMVHPKVFQAAGYTNTDKWQGFAFGMGIDRLAMMKYNIPDIRLLYGADLRVLNQQYL